MAPLLEAAAADAQAAGARAWFGARVVAIVPHTGGSELTIARGRRHEALLARFVIGADGARSRTATALGLDRNRRFLVGVEEVYEGGRGGPPCLRCVVDPVLAPGYLAWVADDGEERHVGVAGIGEGYRPGAALAAFRARLGGELGGRRARERRGGAIPVGGLLPRIASPRGLLVGDAAGAVSPLTAGGLDPCLRQARLAVEVVRRWLGRGQAEALAAYQGEAVRARFRGRRLLRALMDRAAHPVLVELGVAALALAPAREVAERVFFGRGSFPDVDLDREIARLEPDAPPELSPRRS
jgi:flavin-dependent dehydrogenase